jgi:Protein of unknown function (DUF3987)
MSIDWKSFEREILQKLDIKAEAELLGVKFNGNMSNGWHPCHAIDREDNNPSAGICISRDNNGIMAGWYKDFGVDGKPLSFWDLAAKIGPFSDWIEARKHYAKQVGVSHSNFTDSSDQNSQPVSRSRQPTDQIELVEDNNGIYQQQFECWSKTKPPISAETVRESGAKLVRWPKNAPEPSLCIGFPAWNQEWNLNGLILYRIDGEDFAGTNGSKSKKTSMTKGSHDGWVMIGGTERFQNASVIWKTEGVPDALALFPHLPEDQAVVTNICGAMAAANCFPEMFRDKIVYAIGDADEPGQEGVQQFAESIREQSESVFIVPLPFEVTEKHGKDIRDYFNEEHSFSDLQVLADQSKQVEYPWPELVPLGKPDLPDFPVEALPDVLREWVLAESEETQTPPDLGALLALSVCAAALARKVVVQGAVNWKEPVNLFVAVLLEPANRKSAVFSDATRPLRLYERELIDARTPEYKEEIQRKRQMEKRLRNLEEKAAKSGDETEIKEAAELSRELDAMTDPSLPSLIVDDVTSEKLGMILELQGGRIASMSPEGGVFDLMAGMYSKNGMAQFGVYLMGHAGDDLKVDRVGRSSLYIPSPAITMGLAIQPIVIQGLADKSAFRGKGLLARFLYSMPESWIGSRKIDSHPVPDSVKQSYHDLIQKLACILTPSDGDHVPVGHVIRLSQNADQINFNWMQEVEVELDDGGQMEFMRDWGGKLVGLTMRLAGILHCVEWSESSEPWNLEISRETMISAIKIAMYATPHAEATLELMHAEEDRGKSNAQYLWRRIEKKEWNRFSQRELHRATQKRFPDIGMLEEAVDLLIEYGYLRRIDPEINHKAGRPKSPEYEVNPEALNRRENPNPNSPNRVTQLTKSLKEDENLNSVNSVTLNPECENGNSGKEDKWGVI